MSSCDECTLEFFIHDSFFCELTDEQFEKLVRLLEPERKWIEDNIMDDFNEEEHSWRTYRNDLWDSLDKKYEKRIEVIIGK